MMPRDLAGFLDTADLDQAMDAGAPMPPPSEGLTASLMHEIASHLARLVETGEPAAIDIISLPLTPNDRVALEAALGAGEVSATVTLIGQTTLKETAWTGVWWVTHADTEGRTIAERIEITTVPEILRAPDEDVAHAATALAAWLGTADDRAGDALSRTNGKDQPR